MHVLRRVFQIQRGEERGVALVVAMMLVASAGLTIGESGVGALFFDRIGADALPVMFIGQGIVGLTGMLLLTGTLGRFDRRRTYVALPLLMAAVVLAERLLAATEAVWVFRTLWLTVTAAYLVQAVYLWGTAGLVTDTRRAKRLFPLFGAGGILGSVAGGLATGPLAAVIGAQNLLVVWVLSLLGTAALCAAVLGVRRSPRAPKRMGRRAASPIAEIRAGLGYVRRSPLLLWMTAASVLFSVLYYTLYQPYAEAANARFPDPDQLAGFFGVFWAVVTGAAFLVSILVANRLLGWFGAAAMVLVLPALYAGSFGVLLGTSTFGVLVALRFGVNVWLQGVSSPAWETLVNVVPESRRDQTRAFLNGGPSQVGTAVAGIIQLVGLSARQLTVIGLIASAITIVVVWAIRRSYTTALVDALRAGRPSVFDGAAPGTPIALRGDAQATALAVEALLDPEPRVRRLAVAMLDAADERGAGALRRALEDEDALVRANAVDALGRSGAIDDAVLGRALADDDPDVRLAATTALRGTGTTPDSLLDDPDAAVRSAAAVTLLAGDARERAADVLRACLADASPERRRAAIGQTRSAAPADVAAFLAPLVADPSPAVRGAALAALGAGEPEIAVPAALDGLDADDPSIRFAALDALDSLDARPFEEVIRRFAEDRAALAGADLDGRPVDRRRRAGRQPLAGCPAVPRERPRDRVAVGPVDDGRQARGGADRAPHARGVRRRRSAAERARDAGGDRRIAGASAPRALGAIERRDVPAGREARVGRASDARRRPLRARVRRAGHHGSRRAHGITRSVSGVERVLALRRIRLFDGLSPSELQRVADIADERTYVDGDVIAGEGEAGDELHIIVAGSVTVLRGPDRREVARRGPGDVIGEMSIITRSPADRVAGRRRRRANAQGREGGVRGHGPRATGGGPRGDARAGRTARRRDLRRPDRPRPRVERPGRLRPGPGRPWAAAG